LQKGAACALSGQASRSARRGGGVRARTLREKVEEKSNFGALFQIQIARELMVT